MRLTNNTDEAIILSPGESLDFSGDVDTMRAMTQRAKHIKVEEVKER